MQRTDVDLITATIRHRLELIAGSPGNAQIRATVELLAADLAAALADNYRAVDSTQFMADCGLAAHRLPRTAAAALKPGRASTRAP